MTRFHLLLIGLLVLLAGATVAIVVLLQRNSGLQVEVATAQRKLDTAAPASPAPVPETVPLGRTLGRLTREVMTEALAAETGADRKLWIRVDPRDREASDFADEIVAVFRGAGWDVQVLDNDGLRFKPGLLLLIGGEGEPPSYIRAAQTALGIMSHEVVTGSGYLSYYESKKRETPDWNGTRFLEGQTYLLVVGRKPDPATAEPVPPVDR